MLKTINKDTKLCISVSARPSNFGTKFQNYLYHELNLNFIYKAFAIKDIQGTVSGIRALNIRGSAVSMPFKESCIPFLDQLDSSAAGIMSVNTIVNNDGFLVGHNTDYSAVLNTLLNKKISPHFQFALRGSGGMAKAVTCALRDAGFKKGKIIARNKSTGEKLATEYDYNWVSELEDQTPELLINVTPIGMSGGNEANELPFSKKQIENAKVIFDVVAVPVETPLILEAKRQNKTIISGADIIVLQAVEQFVLYTGIRPEKSLIDKASQYAHSF